MPHLTWQNPRYRSTSKRGRAIEKAGAHVQTPKFRSGFCGAGFGRVAGCLCRNGRGDHAARSGEIAAPEPVFLSDGAVGFGGGDSPDLEQPTQGFYAPAAPDVFQIAGIGAAVGAAVCAGAGDDFRSEGTADAGSVGEEWGDVSAERGAKMRMKLTLVELLVVICIFALA